MNIEQFIDMLASVATVRQLDNSRFVVTYNNYKQVIIIIEEDEVVKVKQGYYFETENCDGKWIAKVWREEDDEEIDLPVIEFFSTGEDDESVSMQAAQWIKKNGVRV